ncbi:hypothetical protein EYF80_053547 [Liparis tanakae]|uniref:Uncharacterized protein n=1 Tax=Liparis tanakae TaxID=230148 RepID=A0A4Z2F616_9TELE|nr:hypothetical protein EYF80_053547 [Liparis tanakae]
MPELRLVGGRAHGAERPGAVISRRAARVRGETAGQRAPRHGALLTPAQLAPHPPLPGLRLGSLPVWILRGPAMSAREKGPLTKDSVSLLPCFYFVEVGSRRMPLRGSNMHVLA